MILPVSRSLTASAWFCASPGGRIRHMDYTAIAATAGAVTGAVAAIASLWNAYQFSVLKGRVAEQGDNMRAHVNAPGLHRTA